jgi:hypothetical protein
MEVSGQLHDPAVLPPGTHLIGGWVGPRAGLDVASRPDRSSSLYGLSYPEFSRSSAVEITTKPVNMDQGVRWLFTQQFY